MTLARDILLQEHSRLMGQQNDYYQSIVATERLALAGAAAIIAFLYTDLPSFAAGQARVLAALPAAIIVLAALRSLSIYLVMRSTARYLRELEVQLYDSGEWGFHRRFFSRHRLPYRMIEVTTGGFWMLAVLGALGFWLAYRPPPA